MSKDLDFTGAAANNAAASTTQNETLQKLIAAWNSKNARAGKKLGSFGFMAAALAACGGGSSGVIPQRGIDEPVSDFKTVISDNGVATISGVFALVQGTKVFEASLDVTTAKDGLLNTDGLVVGDGVDLSTATSVVLSEGVTLVVNAGSGFDGASVTGVGRLWLLVGDETTPPGDNGTISLNVDITGDLVIDMPDDGDSVTLTGSVDLNGGKLIVSDGVANAEGLTLINIGGVEVNSTLVLSPAQLKELIEDGIEVSGGGDLQIVGVADDEEAAALFDLLLANSNLIKISGDFTVIDTAGTEQTVDIENIINSKFEFLANSLDKQIEELRNDVEEAGGSVASGATLTLTAVQANGRVINGEGNVLVTGLGDAEVDLSGIAVTGTKSATVAETAELAPNTVLGDFALSVASGATLTLSADQADGREITVTGTLIIDGYGPETDIGGITLVGGSLQLNGKNVLLVGDGGFTTIQAAIDAANADDIIVVGPGSFVETVLVEKNATVFMDDAAVLIGGFDVGDVAFTLEGGIIKEGAELASIVGKQAIFVRPGADVTVKDTVFDGTDSTGQDRAIEAGGGASKISVEGATLTDWAAAAIYVNPDNELTVKNSTFTDNLVGIGSDGPAKLIVAGNTFDNKLEAVGLTVGKVIGEFELTGNTFADTFADTAQIRLAYGGEDTGVAEVAISKSVIFVTAGQSIQAAVDAVEAGGTILVGAGTYKEIVTIGKGITLLSLEGTDVTVIERPEASNSIGTVVVTPGTEGVTIGGIGQGFTIQGGDSPAPEVEWAAVYFQGGGHKDHTVQGNTIVANGDAALMTEFNAVIDGFVVDSNLFAGQTFAGGEPATGDQFVAENVARQMVVISGGGNPTNTKNVTFTNNTVEGASGASSKGNVGVSIDVVGGTVSGNTFAIDTGGGWPQALRVRGPDTDVTDNTFTGANTGFSGTETDATYTGNVFTGLVMNGTPGADTFEAGSEDSTLIGGSGNDTFVFSTTQVLNGSDTVTDFANGSNTIKFKFDELDGLVQVDLRGEGTGFESVAENKTVVSADAGLIAVTGATGGLSEANAKVIADALSGLADEDQFYLAFDDGTNTAIFLVADTSDDVVFNADVAELLVTLQGVTADTLDASKFGDFA